MIQQCLFTVQLLYVFVWCKFRGWWFWNTEYVTFRQLLWYSCCRSCQLSEFWIQQFFYSSHFSVKSQQIHTLKFFSHSWWTKDYVLRVNFSSGYHIYSQLQQPCWTKVTYTCYDIMSKLTIANYLSNKNAIVKLQLHACIKLSFNVVSTVLRFTLVLNVHCSICPLSDGDPISFYSWQLIGLFAHTVFCERRGFSCQQLEGLQIMSFKKTAINADQHAIEEMARLREHILSSPYTVIPRRPGQLRIVHLNVRGLLAHSRDVMADQLLREADVVCFTETHLQPTDTVPVSQDFAIYHHDRLTAGGGVAVLCRRPLVSQSLETHVGLQPKCVEIHQGDNNLIVVALYRPASDGSSPV